MLSFHLNFSFNCDESKSTYLTFIEWSLLRTMTAGKNSTKVNDAYLQQGEQAVLKHEDLFVLPGMEFHGYMILFNPTPGSYLLINELKG